MQGDVLSCGTWERRLGWDEEGGVGRAWKASRGLNIAFGKAVWGRISDTYTEWALMAFVEALRQNADVKHGRRRLQQCQYEILFP